MKAPSTKEGDYPMEDANEAKLESNPAEEAVDKP